MIEEAARPGLQPLGAAGGRAAGRCRCVIWIVGPLVGRSARSRSRSKPSRARWIAIGAIVAAGGCCVVAWQRLARAPRQHRRRATSCIAPAPAARCARTAESAEHARRARALRAGAAHAEQRALRRRRRRAGAAGRRALGGRYLYELPWYVIIGAPGSGKTTALLNSGLQFPLADSVGERRDPRRRRHAQLRLVVHRPGGADRHRRPLHHAGQRPRRPTARPGAASSAAARRSRPRQPLNGVLVTVSVSDLLTRSAAERAEHAATVRAAPAGAARRSCGIRFPIYLLVTKCDLLAGFIDYFGDARQGAARARLGLHLPASTRSRRSDLQRFGAEFDALRAAPRRRPDRPPAGRARPAAARPHLRLPAAVRGAARRAAGVRRARCSRRRRSRRDAAAARRLLHQRHAGRHADRPRARRDRAQLPARARHARRRNQASGKSYFLTRLLARGGVRRERPGRHRPEVGAAAHAAGVGAAMRRSPLLTVGAIAAWGVSYVNNRRYVDEVGAARRQRAPAGAGHAEPRLARPAADRCRRSRRRAALAGAEHGDACRGRSASASTRAASSTAPRAGATSACWSTRCCRGWRCASKSSCARRQRDPELQYEALKTYLMLHDPQHFDAEALKSYVDGRLGRAASAATSTAEQRAQLERASRRAARARRRRARRCPRTRRWSSPSRARWPRCRCRSASTTACASRASAATSPSSRSRAPPATTPRWCSRAPAAQPLTKGVPGLFTYDGYHKGFQNEVEQRRAAARRRADLGARRRPSRRSDARRATLPRQRAAARRGAAHLPERIRAAPGRPSSPTSACVPMTAA